MFSSQSILATHSMMTFMNTTRRWERAQQQVDILEIFLQNAVCRLREAHLNQQIIFCYIYSLKCLILHNIKRMFSISALTNYNQSQRSALRIGFITDPNLRYDLPVDIVEQMWQEYNDFTVHGINPEENYMDETEVVNEDLEQIEQERNANDESVSFNRLHLFVDTDKITRNE